MTLTGLLPVLAEDPAVSTLVDLADPSAGDTGAVDVVSADGLRVPLLAARRPLLVVTATARCRRHLRRLAECPAPGAGLHFLAWKALNHERLSPRSDAEVERPGTNC